MAKEAVSSMLIEGAQTIITDVFEDRIAACINQDAKVARERKNHTNVLAVDVEYLRANVFSDELLKSEKSQKTLALSPIIDYNNDGFCWHACRRCCQAWVYRRVFISDVRVI